MSNSVIWKEFLSESKKVEFESGKLDSSKTYIGIDFGTSTTVVSVAYIKEGGELHTEHIPLKQKMFTGRTVTDFRVNSALAVLMKGSKPVVLIGKGAKQESPKLTRNVDYWQSFKMELGTDVGCAYPNSISEHFRNPQDVATFFFKGLRSSILKYIEENNLSNNVHYSITIPASFEANQRKDLIDCLNSAGINVTDSALIDEPNAAFLSYFIAENDKNNNSLDVPDSFNPNVLVFDFGAGTCDISILEVGKDHKGYFTKNIAISQFTDIGGDTIDEMIARKCLLPQLLEQSGKKKRELRKKEIDNEIIPHLIPFAENLKVQASDAIDLYEELLDLPDKDKRDHTWNNGRSRRFHTRIGELNIEKPMINLQEFIDISSSFQFDTDFANLEINENPIFSALNKAKLTANDIDYLLFIGGSSKNMLIRRQVEGLFKRSTTLVPSNLQSHVSKGAAIHSLFLDQFDTQIIHPIANQRIFTVISHNEEEFLFTIVKAGTPVPFPSFEMDQFSPQRNGQEIIEIPLFLGKKSSELGKVVIKSPNPNGFSQTDNITLKISMNANKILHLEASVNDIRSELKIQNPYSSIGKTLVEKKIQEAQKNFNVSTRDNGGIASRFTYIELAKAYEDNGDYLSAAEIMEEANENHNLKDFNRLDILFTKAGHQEKALYYSEKELSKSPYSATAYFNLACKWEFMDSKKSIELMRKCHELRPNDPSTCYFLGRLLKNDEGRELREKALKLFEEKLSSNDFLSHEYSWFKSCARSLGRNELVPKIDVLEEDADSDQFYTEKNLMSKNHKNDK